MIRHLPERPSWDCRGCGLPWPCETARREAIDRYGVGTVGLGQWALEWLMEAAGELPQPHPRELWWRFVEWTR